MNLDADKHPFHLKMRTLVAKSDSTSSRSAIVENQVSQLEFLNSGNTKVQRMLLHLSDFKDDGFYILERSNCNVENPVKHFQFRRNKRKLERMVNG